MTRARSSGLSSINKVRRTSFIEPAPASAFASKGGIAQTSGLRHKAERELTDHLLFRYLACASIVRKSSLYESSEFNLTRRSRKMLLPAPRVE